MGFRRETWCSLVVATQHGSASRRVLGPLGLNNAAALSPLPVGGATLSVFQRSLVRLLLLACLLPPVSAFAEPEYTPQSEEALRLGLQWLAANQTDEGNWTSNDLGLVSLGALAFMAAGHAPGRGEHGEVIDRALNYVVRNAKPSGLLNASHSQRDMYNHGLATFALGQIHGMTTSVDPQLYNTLDRALRLIANTQCDDGGWDYRARRQARGHDLSLVVMQAKALRSAVDCGLEVPADVIALAVGNVREYYTPDGAHRNAPESEQQRLPGQFTYSKGGGGGTLAMAAAGVVCLQEFGQYEDWRIAKNLHVIRTAIGELPQPERNGKLPFDAYTSYYVAQALYQVGGPVWTENYPALRNYLIASQMHEVGNDTVHGSWRDNGAKGGGKVGGRPGELFGTSVACLLLAIPNRYLPILQEGRIESIRSQFGTVD